MVVALLITTMANQGGMNPPGGDFPGNKEADFIGTSSHISYDTGKAVMSYTHPKSYKYFIYANSTALVASFRTILLLIAITYGIFIYIITPENDIEQLSPVIEIVVAVWCFVIELLMIGNTFQLAYKWITKKLMKELKKN
ncbi:hypothetical protein H5410_064998 [Solanum commersonii]|uniref:PGG domain-containing protein n=1 Tax=Solanum commersonii TaxID=4109 RepID=A0A9J5VXT0_SOLCO|nr:hypothetical protein H5410_064998 [Solanum commersonii]